MLEQKSSYRQIMKATSIFGGVQAFQVIIGIIRSKCIAILLGTDGFGLSGLFTSSLEMISGITSFGISTSAIKDISSAHANNDITRLTIVYSVLMKLTWATGLLGTFLTLIFSTFISEIVFGSGDYAFEFSVLSVTLLINQISIGQGVLLRGMRYLKYVAKYSLIGSSIGLITSIPLYYFFETNGIVPAIVISSVTSLLLSWVYVRRINIKSIPIKFSKIVAEGGDMMKMGVMISLSGIIGLGASFLIKI